MVSIVLVTYNRARRLELSIRDILHQTFQDFELIICDDCSPDNTEAVCREFEAKDSRVRYFRHAKNKQMPANLNFGIEQARSEYVAILHDGDRFREDLIEQWYNALVSNPNVGVVFNTLGDCDHMDRIVKVNELFPEGVLKKEYLLDKVYFRFGGFNSPIYGEAMVRKSIVQRYGYLKSDYSFYADVDFWMELLHHHDAYYCADMLIKTPLKSVQPHEFEDDIVRFNTLLVDMYKKHWMIAFRQRPLKLVYEMVICHSLTIVHMAYIMLLVTKNFSFSYFVKSRKVLAKYAYLMPIWLGLLLFYPLVRMALRTLIRTKPVPAPDEELMAKSTFRFSQR